MLALTTSPNSNSQNVFTFLQNRELGKPRFIKNKVQIHKENLFEGNYTKTIFNGHEKPICNFHVKGELAVTWSKDRNVRLWQLNTGECLWSIESELYPDLHKKPYESDPYGKIKIVGDRIIFHGMRKSSKGDWRYGIESLNLNGVRVSWISGGQIKSREILITGNRIFQLTSRNKVQEWDHDVNQIGESEKKPEGFKIITINGYLINISGFAVSVHDPITNETRNFDFPQYKHSYLSCFHLNENYLIAGYGYYFVPKPGYGYTHKETEEVDNRITFCIIDLTSGKQTPVFLPVEKKNLSTLALINSVSKIVSDKNRIFLTPSHGQIFAYNIEDDSHCILGEHKLDIEILKLKGEILYSHSKAGRGNRTFSDGSSVEYDHKAKGKFWDTTTLKEISIPKFSEYNPEYNKLKYNSEKVYFIVEKSFVQLNYNVTHKGEKFAEGSALKIKKEYLHW